MGAAGSNRLKTLFEYWLARVVLASLAYTPLWLADRLAHQYARTLDAALPRLRRTAYRNLAFAIPGADPRLITDGVFRTIGRLLLSFARLPQIGPSNVANWIRYEGYEHFENALGKGRGVLFATAHLGNWELSAYAHALLSKPMHIVVRPLDNPRIDSIVEQRRRRSGNRVIEKKDSVRAVLRALAANEAVGILIDQNVTPQEGLFVPFFGKLACSGLAFARIANKTGAAVIPGFALWEEAEKRYVLRFLPEIEMSGDESADTQQIHSVLERVIRQYPDQWLWVHRRWKTRPAGEPPLY